jgi:hypothetical protein
VQKSESKYASTNYNHSAAKWRLDSTKKIYRFRVLWQAIVLWRPRFLLEQTGPAHRVGSPTATENQ